VWRRDEDEPVETLRAHRLVEHRRQGVDEVAFLDLLRGRRGGESIVMRRGSLGRTLPRMIAREIARLAA
jgi:hypothetical protein